MVIERCEGELPEGCKMCRKGSKLVLLVTGLCGRECYYCPLSKEKQGRDVTYVNEAPLPHPDMSKKMILDEARDMRAEGTGMTGGDPMMVPGRTVDYIRLLKDSFGEHHHIHLYTAGLFDPDLLGTLALAGLDEIRFHPPLHTWDSFEGTRLEKVVDRALETNMDVGVEIPVIPERGMRERIMELIQVIDNLGVLFINLNELEFSESNLQALGRRSFTVKTDISSAAKDSEELALDIMKTGDYDLTVHYCSSAYKDRVQLRKRIRRRAKNVQKPHETMTDDDTFIMGVVECDSDLMRTREELMAEFDIPLEFIHVNIDRKRIEIASWILEEIAEDIEHPCYLVEEYPTLDRLEVERTPIE